MTTTTHRFRSLVLALAIACAPACKTKLTEGTVDGDGRPTTPTTPLPTDDTTPTTPTPGDDQGHGNEWGRRPVDYRPGEDIKDPGEPPPVEEEEPPVMMRSTKNDLAWKRMRAVENDVTNALALDKAELCNEVGQFHCVDRVHLAPLGGNEPFESGQYRPAPSPTATTAAALERVVLSGCVARVEKDKASAPLVFASLDLDGAALDPNDPSDRDAADATTTALYRRFLARDPLATEMERARALMVDDEGGLVSPETFAVTACFAIGTSVENFFY